MQDHRSIPVDVLRDFARSEAERKSIRQAALEAGVGRTTLHSFVNAETKAHPRVLRLLGLWYLAKQSEAPDIDVVRPYSAALDTLLSAIPPDEQAAARALLVDDLRVLHGMHGPVPRWLELLNLSGPIR